MIARLPLPYAEHPAFRFEVSQLRVSADDVREFSDAYARAERDGGAVAEQQRARLQAILGRLFDSLTGKSRVPNFDAFLAELRRSCTRLLDTDLDHFAQQIRDIAVPDPLRPRLQGLQERRFFFDRASEACVEELLRITAHPLTDLRRAAAGGRTSREELSINGGATAKRLVSALNREFERSGVLEIVSAYARRTMEVSGCALELSIPTAKWWRNQYELARPPRTLYAHTDEGLANPKSILYLTDVTPHTGPMSLFPGGEERLQLTPLQKLVGRVIDGVGSAPASTLFDFYGRAGLPRGFAAPEFRRHFALLPDDMRYNSHFGWDVIPDSELERTLVDAEIAMLGPAGTYAVFDGANIIHRGGMVHERDRVALQIVFSAHRSRLARVVDRVASARRRARTASERLSGDIAAFRRRAGRVVQQLSPDPHTRLVRAISRVLPHLACFDVGASYYAHAPWEVFRSSPRTLWVAVEPNPQNTKYLDEWHWPSRTHLIGTGLSEQGGEQILYVTNVDSGSSLLPPVINEDIAHRFVEHDYFFPVVERRIQTMSFDDAMSNAEVQEDVPLFIKLDTQGTELSILRGAKRAIGHVVGIESEATMLANPVMAGAGKFWEMCQFLESQGFELLQMKPIEGGPAVPSSKLHRRTYLNECDAVFCLRRSELARRPQSQQLAAIGFYLSYHLYAETLALFDAIDGIDEVCARSGVSAAEIRDLLRR